MANLVTLTEYKDYMGLKKPDEDGKLNFLISSVSSLIKAYLGFGLVDNYSTPIVEYASFEYDTDVYFTQQWPINQVLEIAEIDRYTQDSTVHLPLNSGVDYTVGVDRIYRNGSTSNFCVWPVGPNTVRITYTAGYQETPAQVKLAAFELINYYREEQFKQSKTILGSTIVNVTSKAKEWPAHITLLLDEYKAY